jgi:hypothetical protein
VLPPVESTKNDDQSVVLFLIDNTVATVPASLPQFDVHYNRFLQACYANKVRNICKVVYKVCSRRAGHPNQPPLQHYSPLT